MKTHLLVLILCICSIQTFYSQEDDGVVSLSLPVRNSLTFNRQIINPTFSFVREQNKYISFFNKREWVQFDDAPLTYLASYSGRFRENIGAGLTVFQQNYGVLTTFGGVLNFAYNARLARESNLTFGLNVGAYKSGVNTSNAVTNFDDPSLQNVPENFLLTISPGINYGLAFIDFGVSINNLATYNLNTSEIINDDPEQSVQAHLMYTGYMNSRGFLDESKFTGLIKSEFQKDETIVSAIAMLTVPKGIWAQVGFNSRYGASGGIGLNISSQIAIEYNFEKALGDLTDFGPSHDVTLAYRFKNKERYDYSSGDEVSGLLISEKRRKPIVSKIAKEKAEANRKLAAEEKAKEEADAQAKLLAEQKAKEEADAQAKLLAEQKAKEEADAQAKLLVEQKAKEEADAQAKLLVEQKAKEEAEAQAKLLAEQKAKEEADAQAKLLVEQKAKEEADAQAKLLAEQKAKEEADAKLLVEQKAKEEAEAQAKLLAEQKAKEEADAQAKLLAEQKAKEEADAQAKLLAEQKAKEELITNPTDEIGKSMLAITQQTEDSKTIQNELLKQFDDIVEIKDKDLKDLKEENDLSEQGITVQPKPFKSITAENNALEAIKVRLDNVIDTRNEKIETLKSLYQDKFQADTITNDEVYLYYQKALKRLESEQTKAMQTKSRLETRLEDIKVATEFERRRRIKRAAFDNEEERYLQDRATLKVIKQSTVVSNQPLSTEDFDFGEEQSGNIQILKNVKNVENGYYLIIAVHSDVDNRNDFVKKVIASGEANVDFFYDVNTSKYYIYYDKFDSIEAANRALNSKEDRPYNKKMSLVKIEN
ncbi:PorP/SprF family type IX secretion system membrane protein [Ichthyenterobacterium magnum]|uniref:Type IX secretion system PorP/SprF family membrane protein n=1 Tax=Ichthyenterobacterium magnum TaxID=1230530 RepID=A0A420DME7_9FLAO|nr:PorP/SprF family type IX secretion system membrane protein [Ichthyenterobacterium magnum]RKE95368.1 type IX secretion system PorP/SprF family membrane protein [Ichthyenterobacterium magnum]